MGLKATLFTLPLCPLNSCIKLPLRSHSLIVLFLIPVAKSLASGLKIILKTGLKKKPKLLLITSSETLNSANNLPSKSKILVVLSIATVATIRLFELKATSLTLSLFNRVITLPWKSVISVVSPGLEIKAKCSLLGITTNL